MAELVQSTTKVLSPTGTTITATLGSNVRLGSALIVTSGIAEGDTISGITGGGVTFSKARQEDDSGGDTEIWYGFNSSGGGGTTSIVVTYTGSLTNTGADSIAVYEFAGISTYLTSNGGNSTAASSTFTSAAITPGVYGALIVAVANGDTGLPSGNPSCGGATGHGLGTVGFNEFGYVLGSGSWTSQTLTWPGTTGNECGLAVAAFGPSFVPMATIGHGSGFQAVNRAVTWMKDAASGLFTPDHERERIVIQRLAL